MMKLDANEGGVCAVEQIRTYRKPSSFPNILGAEVTGAFYKVQF